MLLPVILNFVVGLEQPNNISVVGYPETWIGFYGSYIGGVLTALIGFLTLWQTSKNNDKNLRIAYQKSIVEDLERTLAQCVSLFDFSRLGTISLYFDSPNRYDYCLQELDLYCHHVTTVANAWGVVYEGNPKHEVQRFQTSYQQCHQVLVCYLNKVTDLIVKLKMTLTDEERTCIKCEIKDVLAKAPEYQEMLRRLFDNAKQWIESERAELRKLQEK